MLYRCFKQPTCCTGVRVYSLCGAAARPSSHTHDDFTLLPEVSFLVNIFSPFKRIPLSVHVQTPLPPSTIVFDNKNTLLSFYIHIHLYVNVYMTEHIPKKKNSPFSLVQKPLALAASCIGCVCLTLFLSLYVLQYPTYRRDMMAAVRIPPAIVSRGTRTKDYIWGLGD